MSNCSHLWSTNSGQGGEPVFRSGRVMGRVMSAMHVSCVNCDARTWYSPEQWDSMQEKLKTTEAKRRCTVCGCSIDFETEPEKDGTYWCPTCDQAGATPSC